MSYNFNFQFYILYNIFIFHNYAKTNRLEQEKRRNKESDIAKGAEARQKRLKTPTADNAREDGSTERSEKDQTVEGNHTGATGSGRKIAVTD